MKCVNNLEQIKSPTEMRRKIKKELKKIQEDLALEHYLDNQASAIWHKNHHKRQIEKLNKKASELARQHEMFTNMKRLRGEDIDD